MSPLEQASDALTSWLFETALPLWWEQGADHNEGGYHDALDGEAHPVGSLRRARVQTRQAYVYAEAGRMGWPGPWREAMAHGMTFFLQRHAAADGLYRPTPGPDGGPPSLYDQAFALFAMAHAARAGWRRGDMVRSAGALLEAIQALRLAEGGFRETGPGVERQSNPHMHLLEAAMAWEELEPAGPWSGLADEIAVLALSRFIDAEGRLHEFFRTGWRFAEGVDGRIIEPGHQFEWAWLLERWGRRRGRPEIRPAAERLYRNGLAGIDRARGVANQQLLDDGTVHDAETRLWPQTEWIKAALAFGDEAEALKALAGLKLYIDTPAPGLWRDRMRADGSLVEAPAPASSFYHIVLAASELRSHLRARAG